MKKNDEYKELMLKLVTTDMMIASLYQGYVDLVGILSNENKNKIEEFDVWYGKCVQAAKEYLKEQENK